MALKFKKSYKFAFKSSLYISCLVLLFFTIFELIFFDFNWLVTLFFTTLVFSISFYIIQYRVEIFVYRRIKKIYDDISLLDKTSITNQFITTDIATLNKEINKYALEKKLEIESLKIRESYRREFLGNVSHELKTPLFMIQGYLSTLLDGAMHDKAVLKKYLERADNGV